MFSIHSSPIGKLGSRDTGGMSVYIRGVSQQLGRLGHTVDIYTVRSHASDETVIALGDNVNLIQLGTGNRQGGSPENLYRHLPYFFQELEKIRIRRAVAYDLIHSHYWLSGLMGKMFQEHWERPHLMTFHTLAAVKNRIGIGKPVSALRLNSESNLTGDCHLIISPTERERQQLNRYYDVAPDKVVIIPCGVDLELFKPTSTIAARKELGYAQDDSILLYIGRFEPLKGIDRLIEAAAILRPRHKVQVVIVGGDGPQSNEEKSLRAIVELLGIQDQVTFVGLVKQHHLPLYYSAADALVVPSLYESFGLVALESLACGTPIVTSPVGAVDQFIMEGRNGYVVESPSPQSLAGGIRRLLSPETTGQTMLASDQIRASIRRYSWETVAGDLAQEYKNICNSGELA